MHLNVITTLRCNLNCGHCLYGCPVPEDLPPERFASTLDALLPHNLGSVTLTGGEPGLHPDFDTLVNAVAARGLRFGIASNGWCVDDYERVVQRHRELFTGFSFSLDGMEATHDAQRHPGAFVRVARAMDWFVSQGLPCRITFVLSDVNRHEMDDVLRFARTARAAGVKLGGVIPVNAASDLSLSSANREEVYRAVPELAERHDIPIDAANSLLSEPVVPFCPVLETRTLTLDSKGRISFCCDVPLPDAVLGEPGDDVVEVLGRRRRVIDEILLDRILKERQGGLSVDDRWCAYCHDFFGVGVTRGA